MTSCFKQGEGKHLQHGDVRAIASNGEIVWHCSECVQVPTLSADEVPMIRPDSEG